MDHISAHLMCYALGTIYIESSTYILLMAGGYLFCLIAFDCFVYLQQESLNTKYRKHDVCKISGSLLSFLKTLWNISPPSPLAMALCQDYETKLLHCGFSVSLFCFWAPCSCILPEQGKTHASGTTFMCLTEVEMRCSSGNESNSWRSVFQLVMMESIKFLNVNLRINCQCYVSLLNNVSDAFIMYRKYY